MIDWLTIPGWFGTDDAATLQRLIGQTIGEWVVEVGSYCGRSSVMIAQYLNQERAPLLRRRLLCVDNWQGVDGVPATDIRTQFYNNTDDYDHIIAVCESSSVEASAVGLTLQIGLVFLDANHSYNAVRQDIQHWWPHIRKGGVMCGHDFESHPEVKRAVLELLPDAIGEGNMWHCRKQ